MGAHRELRPRGAQGSLIRTHCRNSRGSRAAQPRDRAREACRAPFARPDARRSGAPTRGGRAASRCRAPPVGRTRRRAGHRGPTAARGHLSRARRYVRSRVHRARCTRGGSRQRRRLPMFGGLRRDAGDLRGAAEACLRALAIAPEDLVPRLELAVVLIGLGQASEAEALLRYVLNRDPDSPEGHGTSGSRCSGRAAPPTRCRTSSGPRQSLPRTC